LVVVEEEPAAHEGEYIMNATATATAQTATELKPSYFRYTLKQQDNRVEYRILSSEADHYYVVQMNNGRAINCYHEDGTKCQARRFHPGVPCKHMERANSLEQARRTQAKTEAAMQQESFTSLPAETQTATCEEVKKCQEAYERVMAQPIAAQEGTPEYWKAAQKREKRAKQAYRKQYALSQKRLQALTQKEPVEAA
jgi:hypothetical protein